MVFVIFAIFYANYVIFAIDIDHIGQIEIEAIRNNLKIIHLLHKNLYRTHVFTFDLYPMISE